MKLRSFRVRIALLAATLAGCALVGFGLVAWRLIYIAKVSRLDANLENSVKRTVRPRSPEWWQPYEASLVGKLRTDGDTPIILLVVGADGKTIYQSNNWSVGFKLRPLLLPRPSSPSSDQLKFSPTPRISTQQTTVGSWRVAVISSNYAQGAIAVSLEAIDEEMRGIRNIFAIAISGIFFLVAVGAWALSGKALFPINKLTEAIAQVTVTGLDRRVPIGTTDVEFVELIRVFNQMLERLERSFQQASRFSGDAAHELKTPLAILQGELERMMQQAEPGSPLQQNLSNLLDEVSRLNGIVRKLLLLSLADAGQMSLHNVEVNLSQMLAVIVEDLELLAPDLKVQTDIRNDLWVWGDRDLLAQVLQNLIGNAIKYNLPDGWIKIQAWQQEAMVRVTVTNSSEDIPECDRDRLFDRFYRGDPARTRQIEGVGLGLSLSREIAKAHHGELTLDRTPMGQTAFTLMLRRH